MSRAEILEQMRRMPEAERRELVESIELEFGDFDDALTPEQLKQQSARLKRVAEKKPLVVSAATGAGVPEVLRALLRIIDQDQTRPTTAAGACFCL